MDLFAFTSFFPLDFLDFSGPLQCILICMFTLFLGRGVLSMSGLSHGVVRVDQENSLTSLTLQDCGQVLPGATLIVIKVESPQPLICKTDEVGEICMASTASGSSYWGLPGLTNTTFKLRVNESSTAESQSTVSQKTFKNVQNIQSGNRNINGKKSGGSIWLTQLLRAIWDLRLHFFM